MRILSSKFRLAAGVLCLGAVAATSAHADVLGQPVSGTTGSSIALSAETPATFGTGLVPGTTATSTGGALTAVDTNPSWTLKVHDSASTAPGHMVAAAVGCSGSESSLSNPLSVTVTPLVANGSITSAGAVALSGTAALTASATSVPLAATVFTTTFSQTIGAGELLASGCLYTLTAT